MLVKYTTLFLCMYEVLLSCAQTLPSKSFDVRLPSGLDVPTVQTTYVCQQVMIPAELLDKRHYITAFEALINNSDIMHHMIVFGCKDGAQISDPHVCGEQENLCRSFLTVWSLGFHSRTNLYKGTGIPIGKNGYSILSLQIHWNNQHLLRNITDSSGMRIFYSEDAPSFEVGNVQVGQDALILPPGERRIEQRGGCSTYCSSKLKEPIYLTRTFIHMHSLAVSGRLDHYRGGKHLQTVAYDEFYSYQRPPVHEHEHSVQILPGDELMLTCWYNTADGRRFRNHTVYWGEGVEGEMCYAFISYFPKRDNFDQCVQYDAFDQCDNYNQMTMVMGKCDFRRFVFDVGDSLHTIRTSCDVDGDIPCSGICAKAASAVYEHPCMQGKLAVFLQRRVATTVNWSKIAKLRQLLHRKCGSKTGQDTPMRF